VTTADTRITRSLRSRALAAPHYRRRLCTVGSLSSAVLVLMVTGCGSGAATPAVTVTVTAPAASGETPGAAATDPATATGTGSTDACALFTRQDAEKLVKTPLDAAEPGDASCVYNGPTTGPTAQVSVYVGDGAKKTLDIDRQFRHTFTKLSGAGQEAELEDSAVFVLVRGTWVEITVVRLNDPAENRGPLKDAAATVAGRF